MTEARFLALTRLWFRRGTEAAERKAQADLTVALLAHDMCCAAYLGVILSGAQEADPALPSPKAYRVRR